MRISKPRLHNFGIAMFLTRVLGVMFLVFSTYNPSGWSLWHWFRSGWPGDWMMLVPFILLYLLIYVLLIVATYRSLRPSGIALTLAFSGSIIWVLLDAGLVRLDDAGDISVAFLYMLGGVIGVGVVWASAWLTLTGQVSVDNITR